MSRHTFSGNRGLHIEEPLLFEIGHPKISGVDLEDTKPFTARLGGLERTSLELPGVSEPVAVRHFVRLSQKNYSIDTGTFPLGSCTMKHNPRLNEKIARLPGFLDIHPLQPIETVQGALAVMGELSAWLKALTGMPAISLSPKAGAHGELCGMTAIYAAHVATGQKRTRILVPDSAHGTNPATAATLGYTVDTLKTDSSGRVTLTALKDTLADDVAALMITNPNTCGLFETHTAELATALHEAGAYLYCDGANFNALVGRVKPGELGIDAMHINLHKTFSTPHGGGGPGAGPVVFSKALAPYAPLPRLEKQDEMWCLKEDHQRAFGRHAFGRDAFGRLAAFHGQMGMFTRALAYILSHGRDGLRCVSGDAVLNANYILASLRDVMSTPYTGYCMHEVLFDGRFLKGTGLETLDFAKALIDEGYHPMTVYFPLVVEGAMLIEPTETESLKELDTFISTLRALALSAVQPGGKRRFTLAPRYAPRRRLDETGAARQPILRWVDL